MPRTIAQQMAQTHVGENGQAAIRRYNLLQDEKKTSEIG